MKPLKTVSKRLRVQQAASSASLDITFNYDHEEGKLPELIAAKGVLSDAKAEDPKRMMLDVILYPSTNNLQVTCHNKPAAFDASIINEVTEILDEIVVQLKG